MEVMEGLKAFWRERNLKRLEERETVSGLVVFEFIIAAEGQCETFAVLAVKETEMGSKGGDKVTGKQGP